MAKEKRDVGLILSLGLIIAIASYWFIKEVPMVGVEHYVDLLGEKLMTLIPKEQDKKEVAAIYEEFRSKVKEKKVRPENVEQVASAIINLSNASDSLTRSEAEALIQIAIKAIPADSVGLVHVPDVEATPEEWEELNKRLSGVYKIEKSLKDHVIVSPKGSKPPYRVDENLNIIVDSRVKRDLEKARLEELEKHDQLFWRDSVTETMEKNLQQLEIELKVLSEEMENIDIQHNLLKLKVLSHPVGNNMIITLDSLDIVNIINWDSLKGELKKEMSDIEQKRSPGIDVRSEN
jgi:hypothetical protein